MNDKKRLLVVNDDILRDAAYKNGFIEIFTRRGAEALVVATAKEALEAVKKSRFDLVVTDIALEEGNEAGLELIKNIKSVSSSTLVFVSTGYGNHYKERAAAAGADGYYDKPYDMNELFFKPLGLTGKPVAAGGEKGSPGPRRPGVFTLRFAFHEISNRHNDAIMISSILEGTMQSYLEGINNLIGDIDTEEGRVFVKMREIIESAIYDLRELESVSKRAETLLKKVGAAVYGQVDPDKVTLNLQE